MKQWLCNRCDEIVNNNDLLSGWNPFDEDENIHGCPKCRQCNEGFHMVCDEPGCTKRVSCGWPSESGYRQTCHDHYRSVEIEP